MIAVLADLAFVGLLAGFVALAPWIHAGPAIVIALLLLASLSPLPPRSDEKLPWHHGLALAGLLLLLAHVPVDATTLITGGLLCVLGLARAERGWTSSRTDWTLGAGVTIVACALVAFIARGALAVRSGMALTPGRVDFLPLMLLWGAAWFGLDAQLRSLPTIPGRGLSGVLWQHRHALGGLTALALILILGPHGL